MNDKFKAEACQLYIQQEIDSRLADGKTPGKLAEEIVKEVETLFEATVKHATIKKRAQRRKAKSPSKNRDKSGHNRDKSGQIVIRDAVLIGTLRDISKTTGMDINTIIALGVESYKNTYL